MFTDITHNTRTITFKQQILIATAALLGHAQAQNKNTQFRKQRPLPTSQQHDHHY